MGCGSSRSAVAVVETSKTSPQTKTTDKNALVKKTSNLDHFIVSSSSKESKKDSSSNSLKSQKSIRDEINASKKSLRSNKDREQSATSIKSKDSGVFDDNIRRNSAGATSISSKPSSASKSSARKKLLRIDDNNLINSDKEVTEAGINMISKPKTKFGNVAFDIVLDTPETGNIKKRQLPQLEKKRKKSSKKVKTREEIEKKMQQAEERRRIQEVEKQMKAKQFQHLSIHTSVQPFQPPSEDESDVNNNSNELQNKDSLPSVIENSQENLQLPSEVNA